MDARARRHWTPYPTTALLFMIVAVILASTVGCASVGRDAVAGSGVSIRMTVTGDAYAGTNLKHTVIIASGTAHGGLYSTTEMGTLQLYGSPIDAESVFLVRVDGETVFESAYSIGGVELPSALRPVVDSVMDVADQLAWGITFAEP